MIDNKKTLDDIVENLFYALPVIHKRLMRIDPPRIKCGIRLSRQHFGILAMVHEIACPISEIAATFLIPKPRMTYLVDQMEKAGLIKRNMSRQDRRITNIALTPKGKNVFRYCDEYLKNNVRDIFAGLAEKELEDLSKSLKILRDIGPRFEGRGK
jgi:MarR family transcriptional regulator, 2-MHQ and catechol-resistance regulon repressor